MSQPDTTLYANRRAESALLLRAKMRLVVNRGVTRENKERFNLWRKAHGK